MTRWVLVTGGCGYIGSHVVRELAKSGWTPIVYDNLSTGRPSSIDDHKLIQGDVLDIMNLHSAIYQNKIESVIHLAGKIEVAESMENPGKYFDHNVIGSLNVLRAMRAAGIQNLIFSSSAAVYGNRPSLNFKETDTPNPTNPYGVTKLFVEQAIKAMDNANGLKHVSLRYFNAAGADAQGDLYEHHKPETHLIPNAIAAATTRRRILSVYGTNFRTPDGTAIRDYVHVSDVARAHVMALAHLNGGGKSDIFNVGTGIGTSVLDVIKTIEKASGYTVDWVQHEQRPGDPAILVADCKKIFSTIGWYPRYDFEQIIWSAWKAWRNNGLIQ